MGYDPNVEMELTDGIPTIPVSYSRISVFDFGKYTTEQELNDINKELSKYEAYLDYPGIGGGGFLPQVLLTISLVFSDDWVRGILINGASDIIKYIIMRFLSICRRSHVKSENTNSSQMPSLMIEVGNIRFTYLGDISEENLQKSLLTLKEIVIATTSEQNKNYICDSKTGLFNDK